MDNKYYTPELEDLHIGYICEVFKKDEWINWTTKFTYSTLAKKEICCIVNQDISNITRTKYLDRDDIISLNWTEVKSLREGSLCFEKDEHSITYMPDINILIVYKKNRKLMKIEDCRFHGIIKSINELKTIFKFLNIN